MKYEIKKEMFGDMESLVQRWTQHDTTGAKFNIRVRAADLKLIEKLADLTDRKRPSLLNHLVEDILNRMLQGLHDDDKPSAAILAAYVDMNCGRSDNDSDGWVGQLPGAIAFSTNMILDQAGTSDKSDEILRRIKAAKK